MQRWCSKLRSFNAIRSTLEPPIIIPHSSVSASRLLHSSSANLFQRPFGPSPVISNVKPLFSASSMPIFSLPTHPSLPPTSFMQVRNITAKQKKRKLKGGKPMTPITSKVKKIKIKCYSSYKDRFRTLADGTIRCWKEGKRHNAHSKSKKAKRRHRRPGTVPLAFAKVMKKLNFCG